MVRMGGMGVSCHGGGYSHLDSRTQGEPMLHLLSDQKSKLAAQRRMTSILRQSWQDREVRTIVWRPERVDLPISHDGSLWFGSEKTPENRGVFRFWNSFGQYVNQGNLIITV